ncbi:WYL domain-containing protein [Funiculus sociatus GB2-A5]|uniref:WYL domain-containing protein n=1 Tax=Funiculus sociatus GB2-A5 TaxID=2933946 RepID=A0ABV0JW77_9CYAN|nr:MULTISPECIES: WYL domain-containing protein [unclassified Trichocoleus]MBD1906741.1 WYL domain-containing protein [Trichocoleus sp. FACHB-832]MBD2061474.1 WYL domain-containing protein [Trichocoleus sp. FACHB-6]
MSRKGQSITLSISDRDKAELEAIALELGMMWGDRPNISKLVEAIARRQLLIGHNNDWSETRIRALEQAVSALTDMGQIEQAQIIANLLLERSELSLPLRRDIERFLENLPPPWRLEIDRYIRRNSPFQMSYEDAAGRLWNFTVRYAKVTPHEKRQYLDCWCEETEGNLDIPKLAHNWSLRLDRIQEAAVMPVAGKWRLDLDRVDVEMHLSGGLAFAYKAKPEDIANDWLADRQRVRRVVRKVSSSFWFIREVMQYAPDCVVVSPESVREQVKQKLRSLLEQYDMQI